MAKPPESGRRSVLIAGGYGVVGAQIVELLSQRNPDLDILIGGRSETAGAKLAARIPNARAVRIDVDEADPLAGLPDLPDAVLAVANDANDRLLRAATGRGIAYVDITRWTARMHATILRLAPMHLTSPVVLASGWMAGVAATVAAHDASRFSHIHSINIDILYALKDKAGPNSLDYADRLAIPFSVHVDGKEQMVKPLSDPRNVTFSGGKSFATYRFDTPDQYSLVQAVKAASVSTRLTYDDPSAVKSIRFMLRSGIWSILSLPIFDGLRRSMLFNPGEGDTHEVVVEIAGAGSNGVQAHHKTIIVDPLGQTHMTAAGAVAQLERVLGLRGRAAPPSGTSFPENAVDLDKAMEALTEMGVMIIC